jgi:hypothetical protein
MTQIVRALFPVGAVALAYSVLSPHPLLGARPALIGVAVLCLIAGAAIFTAPQKLRNRPGHKVTCLLPWILTAILVINWKEDTSREMRHSTVILETNYGRGWDSIVVRSWRPGRTKETLYLRSWLLSRPRSSDFHRGQAVTVGTKPGALGLPWMSSLS